MESIKIILSYKEYVDNKVWFKNQKSDYLIKDLQICYLNLNSAHEV